METGHNSLQQVDVWQRGHAIDLSNYVSNGEWRLMGYKVERNVVYYSCCPEPYPDITFTFHIRRRTLYYTYHVIIPCLMLSSLSLLGFWLPPEGSGEKVGLGLTVLLSFSVFMLLIAENMPATSFYMPLIGLYIIFGMGLTCISVLIAVAMSHIYHQRTTNKEIPNWLRKMCVRINYLVKVNSGGRLLQRHLHLNKMRRFQCVSSENEVSTPLKSSQIKVRSGYDEVTDRGQNQSLGFVNKGTKTSGVQAKDGNIRTIHKRNSRNTGAHCGSYPIHGSARTHDPHYELLTRIQKLLDVFEHALPVCFNHNVINSEWQEVSEILDRFLFWVYAVVLTSATVGILVLTPYFKNVAPVGMTLHEEPT